MTPENDMNKENWIHKKLFIMLYQSEENHCCIILGFQSILWTWMGRLFLPSILTCLILIKKKYFAKNLDFSEI
jgi:hypothetical protein